MNNGYLRTKKLLFCLLLLGGMTVFSGARGKSVVSEAAEQSDNIDSVGVNVAATPDNNVPVNAASLVSSLTDKTAKVPTEVTRFDVTTKTNVRITIDHWTQRSDGTIIAVDKDGKEVGFWETDKNGKTIEPENGLFLPQLSTDKFIPMTISISADLPVTVQPLLDQEKQIAKLSPGFKLGAKEPSSLLSGLFWHTANDGVVSTYKVPNQLPSFFDKAPTSGEDVLNSAALYTIMTDTGLDKATILQKVQAGEDVPVSLPDGQEWNAKYGADFIFLRVFTNQEINNMKAASFFKNGAQPQLLVDNTGKLHIYILVGYRTSDSVNNGLYDAFNYTMKGHSKTAQFKSDPVYGYEKVKGDEGLVDIFSAPDNGYAFNIVDAALATTSSPLPVLK